MDGLTIREIAVEDATAAAQLAEELGYATDLDAMTRRIERLAGVTDRVAYVACVNGKVVGWIDVNVAHHLQSEPRAEIGGLVVASDARNGGIGRRLVERAEEWAILRGLKAMLVRSQIAREAAHHFYLRQGYERTETSAVFTKRLA